MTRTLHHLERLISFASITNGYNLQVIDYICEILLDSGFDTYRVPDESGEKSGIFASLGPGGPGGLMLSGHTDVVPVAGQNWSSDPFSLRRDGTRVYGRGTTDMKGFIASMLSLAEHAKGQKLSQPLKMAFSYDEEIGCVGISEMLPHLATTIGTPNMCIVGEPTSMQLALGHKGKMALRAVCTGQAGHSADAPEFINALHLAGDFMHALRQIQQDLRQSGARDDGYNVAYSTVHIGKLSGGVALNIVPDQAIVDFEIRALPGDSIDEVASRIRAAASEISANAREQYPIADIVICTQNRYPGLDANPGDPAARIVTSMLPEAALPIKVSFGTEAGHFAKLGISTVVCGPGSMVQGHKPDEFIELDQLDKCDVFLHKMLVYLQK